MLEKISFKTPLFIVGPAYSGKSDFVHSLINFNNDGVFFGTANLKNNDQRISQLKEQRPKNFKTIELWQELPEELQKLQNNNKQIIIDSINQWLGNWLVDGAEKYSKEQLVQIIQNETEKFLKILKTLNQENLIIISSEIGASLPPKSIIEKIFRQHLGKLNQEIAKICQNVISINCGLPVFLKK